MQKITDGEMEYICDELCRWPREAESQEELDDHCRECMMGHIYTQEIDYEYMENRELKSAKRFNVLSMVLIVVLLFIMGLMMVDMEQWADKYAELETRYEELYESLVEEGER